MVIETQNPTVSMQLKVIGDELYEMMWELQPSPAIIKALKATLNTLADTAWDEYNHAISGRTHNQHET